MVEDGGWFVVGSCRCPRSRPGYLPALADALVARTIRAHPVTGKPIAAASMNFLTLARRRPLQLVDRAFNAMPDGAAIHVAFGHQFIGALGRM